MNAVPPSVVWAKTDTNNNSDLWLSLEQHLKDTASVIENIWDLFAPKHIIRLITKEFNNDEESAKAFVKFVAGLHDVGKASAFFEGQTKNKKLIKQLEVNQANLNLKGLKSQEVRHEDSGALFLNDFLLSKNFSKNFVIATASIVSSHHGEFKSFLINKAKFDFVEDNTQWHETRVIITENWLKKFEEYFQNWNNIVLTQPIIVLITGLVIEADWISSNTEFFPLTENGYSSSHNRSDDGWEKLNFQKRWKVKHEETLSDYFAKDFELPSSAQPRPLQKKVYEIAQEIKEPGLFIIEAPMGVGKTEASLILAKEIINKFDLDGIIFSLPTMATTDAMFERVNKWIKNITINNAMIKLLHSNAAMNEIYKAINNFNAGSDCSDCISTNQWFSRKSALISPVVVSTIDQLLMASLSVKHLALRHIGLAGKVVIIDEVHASDSYMNVFLERTIEWLGYYGSPVILLSATLPPDKRVDLVDAYHKGKTIRKKFLETKNPKFKKYQNITLSPQEKMKLSSIKEYPVIIHNTDYYTIEEKQENKKILIHNLIEKESLPVKDLLKEKLSDGGCAVVIKNTVRGAQELYEQLTQVFPGETLLCHSRFTATDRKNNEDTLKKLFGPNSANRPFRKIVVATQVIEQSLDIDFDVMVSEVAPIDLLLQRMGRLHRHEGRTRPEKVSDPNFYIIGYKENKSVEEEGLKFDIGTKMVYGEYLLYRALIELKGKDYITLPEDISKLVNSAYTDWNIFNKSNVPSSWIYPVAEAKKFYDQSNAQLKRKAGVHCIETINRVEKLKEITKVNFADTDVAGQALVRNSEYDPIDVILVEKLSNAEYSTVSNPPIFFEKFEEINNEKAKKILKSKVSLTQRFCQNTDKTIKELEKNYYQNFQKNFWLEGELVMELVNGEAKLLDRVVSYSNTKGLEDKADN